MTSVLNLVKIKIPILIFLLNGIEQVNSNVTRPLKFESDSCKLTEPVYNYTFDFTILHSELAHVLKSELGFFEFNLCGNSTRNCNNKNNIAACLKKLGKEIVLGTQHKLQYNNGKIYFNFTNGEKCEKNKNHELFVEINCDYTLDQKQLEIISLDEESCRYYLKLETPSACLPEPDISKSNHCQVKSSHSNYVFDLMPLSDFNYRVTTDREDFVINVCKPVLYGQNSMCPRDSSICLINKDAIELEKKFVNYGTVSIKPEYDEKNNQLVLRHSSNVKCDSIRNYTSIIYFVCKLEAGDGKPEYKIQSGCSYEFVWETQLACEKVQNCQGTDPKNGISYDFGPLANTSYTINSKDGKNYKFGICSDGGKPCLESTGACEIEENQTISLGITNTQLQFSSGTPYFQYSSGTKCSESDFYSTRIEFLCPNSQDSVFNNASDKAVVVENSSCQLKIHYETKLACRKKILCKTQGWNQEFTVNNGVIDLTPFIDSEKNYEAKINTTNIKGGNADKLYFLNVCRPLVPSYGLGCPAGSSACAAVKINKLPEHEQSLGYPRHSLNSVGQYEVELTYSDGDICPENRDMQLSSVIKFVCDHKAGKGSPILQSIINNCNYKFDWHTNKICPEHLCKFNIENCEIINDELDNIKFNLKKAKFLENGKIIINETNPWNIEICGDNRLVQTDYSQNTVKISFTTKGPCDLANGLNEINIIYHMICTAIEHRTISSVGDTCDLIITQQTPEICTFLGLETPLVESNDTAISDHDVKPTTVPTNTRKELENGSNESSSSTILAIILSLLVLLSVLAVAVFLIFRNPEIRQRFRMQFSRNIGNNVHYMRVDSDGEEDILLDSTNHLSDSDEDMLV